MAISTTPATGARAQVTVGEESIFGAVISPTHLIKFTSESLAATESTLVSDSIRSDRGVTDLIRGNLDVQGDLNFEQAAAGYGMLIRHSLGDYIRLGSAGSYGVDGGFHARVLADAEGVLSNHDSAASNGNNLLLLGDETAALFPTATGLFSYVYRDTNNNLAQANGEQYDGMNVVSQTYVTAVTDPDTSYTGAGATAVVSIVIAPVFDQALATLVNVAANPEGGYIELGDDRNLVKYFQSADLGGTLGTQLWLDVADVVPSGALVPSVGDAAIVKATITRQSSTGSFNANTTKKGVWIYNESADYDSLTGTAYTHHIERGVRLPIGLTVEIDRDAAIFVYSGCKVATFTVNFETNAIVTATVSLIGRAEASMAELVNDVIPGATEIVIPTDLADAFPTTAQGGGTITIGERTGITYTTRVDNADGTTTLSGIPGAGDAAIDRFHPKNSNVDSRSSIAVDPLQEGDNSPLTSFETLVYMEGVFEEALAASITLNNNLNADKFGLGSRFRLQVIEERAEVEFSLTMEFDDGKHYKRFIQGEFFVLEMRCASEADDSEIGTTGVLSQAYYFLPKCKFNGTTPVVESTAFIQHDMPGNGIVDAPNNTQDLIVILVNSELNDVEA